MGTASIHEGVRRMRFSRLLERTEAKELTQEEASEVLGIRLHVTPCSDATTKSVVLIASFSETRPTRACSCQPAYGAAVGEASSEGRARAHAGDLS